MEGVRLGLLDSEEAAARAAAVLGLWQHNSSRLTTALKTNRVVGVVPKAKHTVRALLWAGADPHLTHVMEAEAPARAPPGSFTSTNVVPVLAFWTHPSPV